MTETKHTSGPWTSLHDTWILGKDTSTVVHSPMTPANARLIAAAPDLLDALRAQADCQDVDGSPCFCGNPSLDAQDEDEHAAFCRQARAAIAKAEGREP